jgi:ADP-L-glycero-D-manno-heptose 6-epimerase
MRPPPQPTATARRAWTTTTAKLDTLRPLNMYGYSKHLFDLHARRAGFLNQIAGLKYFNVFGPNEDHKGDMRSLVHKSFGQVQTEGVIRLFKSYRSDFRDGEQKRDFLYVKDAVAMTLHLAATPKAGGLFNIGSGAARTWLDLARAVFTALNRKPNIQFIEMPEAIRDKYQYFTEANLSRLRAAGYTAPVTRSKTPWPTTCAIILCPAAAWIPQWLETSKPSW